MAKRLHAAARPVDRGLERLEERVSTDPEFPVNARNTDSALAIYQLRAGDQALQANLRVDDSNQYGSHTTGAIEYGYRLSSQWRLTASYGTAFEAPTFNDLYYPGFSNPDLVPETSRNVEGGIYGNGMQGDAQWQLRAIGWYNRVSDLIVFECNASFVCAPQNVQDATLKGIEFGGVLTWYATQIRGSLDLQSPRDDATGLQLPRRALRHGALSITQQLGPVNLGAEVVASSLRYDDAADTIKMGGYAILNLTVEWPLGNGLSLFARGDNVLTRTTSSRRATRRAASSCSWAYDGCCNDHGTLTAKPRVNPALHRVISQVARTRMDACCRCGVRFSAG